jgi:hypothetical protein
MGCSWCSLSSWDHQEIDDAPRYDWEPWRTAEAHVIELETETDAAERNDGGQ